MIARPRFPPRKQRGVNHDAGYFRMRCVAGSVVASAARFVDVVQVTPTVGSTTLTFVEVRTVDAQTSDYLYLTGNLRFRVSGMALKSSNFPADTNMSAKSAE
jgi:hypothetical protein